VSDGPSRPGHRLPRRFYFPRHFAVSGAVTAAALVAEAASGSDWPLFWPLAGWAAVLAIHYFLASSYDPDRDWVDERIADVRGRSYDFDHIQNIEDRIRRHDPSITAPTDRDRTGDRP
jgi:hypothetical protein